MTKPSIYTGFTARAFRLQDELPYLIEYLTTHPHLVMDDMSTAQLTSARVGIHSVLTELSARIISSGKFDLWTLVRARVKDDTPPSALTYRQIPLDMAQAIPVLSSDTVRILDTQPSLKNKIVFNVTPFVQANGSLVDAIEFHGTIVRDALCRSFYQNDRTDWISPGFSQYISKVYTMILGTSVSQWYRLDMKNARIVSFLFALFFLTQIGTPKSAIGILRTQWKYFMVPDSSEQEQIYGLIIDTLPDFTTNGLDTLEDVFAVIDALNIPRVVVDRNLLSNKLRGSLSQDVVYTSFALYYPPIFAYLVLRALAGIPSGMSAKMKQMGLLGPRERDGAISDILHSHAFLDTLF